MREDEEICPVCQGDGQAVIGEHLVSMDMAIDAGDRSLEGQHFDYVYAECDNCCATGIVKKHLIS